MEKAQSSTHSPAQDRHKLQWTVIDIDTDINIHIDTDINIDVTYDIGQARIYMCSTFGFLPLNLCPAMLN